MCVCLYAENRFSSREHTVSSFFTFFIFLSFLPKNTCTVTRTRHTERIFLLFFASFRRGMSESFFSSFSFFLVCRLLSNTQSRKEPEKNRVSKKLVAASSHVRRILRRVKPRIVGSIPGGRGWDTGLFYVVYSEKIIRITTEKHSDDSSDEKRVWCTTTEFVCAGVASARFATFWFAILFRVRARSRARQKKIQNLHTRRTLGSPLPSGAESFREIHLTIAHNEQKQPSRPVNPQTVTRALVLFFARTLNSRENVF